MNPDGSVEVHEPLANVRLRVTPTGVSPTPIPEMPWSSALLGDPDVGAAPARAPAPLEDRVVALFERCADISAASDVRDACTVALGIVQEFVSANAGAVLMTTPDGSHLEFIAAFGPQAQKVVNSTLPVNHGIAGFIRDFPVGVIINDVHRDVRFGAAVDRSSGYETRSLLAVPIRAVDGPTHGCLELLNSATGFAPEDLETTEMIASALGAWLRGAQA
ncbi:MAG: GAF domain-containing protein [Pseudomonadota bacterium]|nr:GAF domain-containing protein [Pseudomonadota bacterium]